MRCMFMVRLCRYLILWWSLTPNRVLQAFRYALFLWFLVHDFIFSRYHHIWWRSRGRSSASRVRGTGRMGDIEGLPHRSRCHPSLPRAKLQLQVHRSLILLALTRSQVAIYLGALTASSAGIGSWITALIAFVAIFFPGLALATGMNSVWK